MPSQEVPTTQRAWKPVLIRDREIVPPRPPDSEGEGASPGIRKADGVRGCASTAVQPELGSRGRGERALCSLGLRHKEAWKALASVGPGSLRVPKLGLFGKRGCNGDNVLVPIWSTPFSHVADKARLGLGPDCEEAASWVRARSSGTALGDRKLLPDQPWGLHGSVATAQGPEW